MIDIKQKITEEIIKGNDLLNYDEVYQMLEIPTDSTMGDYALPCFKLSKIFRKSPPLIAAMLSEKLKNLPLFNRVEEVNGYLNMFIERDFFIDNVLKAVISEKEKYGRSDIGKGKKVLVEFSSPNIAKPFHIGHIRSTVIGNSINLIYKFLGYDVERINHLGDYGTQFGKMIVAYRRWGKKEEVEKDPIITLLSYYVKFHNAADDDPSLEDEAREVFVKLENGGKEETELWQWFRDESLKEFEKVYKMMGIEFDSYAGESFYSDKMGRVIELLTDSGLLIESEGAMIVDLEKYDMSPALIQKKDGSTLYITRDIAAAIYRHEHYDFYKNIYVVAAQQNLHFKQWIKILDLLGFEWAKDCIHVPFGLVSLDDGTMSTRQGNVVFLLDVLNKAIEKTKEVIEEKDVNLEDAEETAKQIGIGAVVFNELANNRIKDYVFNWDKILNFDGETGPYVQYTHARAASVLRKGEVKSDIDFRYISDDAAYELACLIYRFPEVIKEAAVKYEPSIVTRHIVDISQSFNRFYNNEHILVDNEDEKNAKLALTFAAKQTIANGLYLLGIHAPERM